MTTDIEIFKKVKEHLLTQKDRSLQVDSIADCAYLGWPETKINLAMNEIHEEMPGLIDRDYGEFFYLLEEKLGEPTAKCAVGAIIAGRDNRTIEGSPADDTEVIKTIKDSNPDWSITDKSVTMLCVLQKIHDRVPVVDWEAELKKVEKSFTEDGIFDTDMHNYSS